MENRSQSVKHQENLSRQRVKEHQDNKRKLLKREQQIQLLQENKAREELMQKIRNMEEEETALVSKLNLSQALQKSV